MRLLELFCFISLQIEVQQNRTQHVDVEIRAFNKFLWGSKCDSRFLLNSQVSCSQLFPYKPNLNPLSLVSSYFLTTLVRRNQFNKIY